MHESDLTTDLILTNIFNNFCRFINHLKADRYNGRVPFLSDEYDVQDLLYAILKLHFDDIQREYSTPPFAGSSNRIDFLINKQQTAIEVKYAKDKHKDKEIGDELLNDINKYSKLSNCNSLYCFVYDPNHCICNPSVLENDLVNSSPDLFKVKVFIKPIE